MCTIAVPRLLICLGLTLDHRLFVKEINVSNRLVFVLLRLRDNQITDKGAELLMEALTKNTTLEHLW